MDAPFDRGEVDRASLDATERLRARLAGTPRAAPPPRRRGSFAWIVVAMLFVFALGLIANPWFESTVRSRLPFAAAPAATTDVAALQARIAQLEGRAPAAAPMPSERLARTEAQIETSTDQIARDAERIDRLTADVAALTATIAADKARGEAAAATASAAADRAQGMLTLVLVRRAIDTGRTLGALEAVLRQGFEARYPQAVQQVVALGAAPVTLASLRRDFARIGPAAGAPPTTQSWWDTLTTTISNAVSHPAADGPGERAIAALARGDIPGTAAQLRRTRGPRSPALTAWLAAADRWQAGNAALATLETATLLPPATVVAVPMPPATPPAATPPVSAPPAAASSSSNPARQIRLSRHLERWLPRLNLRLERLF
jgi:type II secretory pathway component PulM